MHPTYPTYDTNTAQHSTAPTFPRRHSISCAMVIRLGMACGFTMMSGTIPSIDHGMSSCLYVIPMVPFCPCRDANLSPICGTRTLRIRTCGEPDEDGRTAWDGTGEHNRAGHTDGQTHRIRTGEEKERDREEKMGVMGHYVVGNRRDNASYTVS